MNILLTSVGRRSYVVQYFKDALHEIGGKVFASNSAYTIAMPVADEYFITPLIHEKGYIEYILEICLKNDVSAVMSLFDIDLPILAQNRELFKSHGIRILLADADKINICNDKWQTKQLMEKLHIGTPKTFLTLEDTINGLSSGELEYPLIIKPRWGMGSIGIYSIENEAELTVLSEKCKREIMSTYLKYESRLTPDHTILYQQKIVGGQEYGLDIINDLDGNYITSYAKKKITMRAGETDIGETVSVKPFESTARTISEYLKHEVICSLDCFIKDGLIYVTELNCRISGHYPLSHLAGVKLPQQIIKWLNGQGADDSLLWCKEGLVITKDLVPVIIEDKNG